MHKCVLIGTGAATFLTKPQIYETCNLIHSIHTVCQQLQENMHSFLSIWRCRETCRLYPPLKIQEIPGLSQPSRPNTKPRLITRCVSSSRSSSKNHGDEQTGTALAHIAWAISHRRKLNKAACYVNPIK